MERSQKELAKVIEGYFGADAAYLDIDVFTLAKRIIEAGWIKPVRCKGCKYCHQEKDRNWCEVFDEGYHYPNDDDFCSCGERKTNG